MGTPALNFRENDPLWASNFHRFISSDVQMTLPLIPKWEYWE